jgi:putative membrane protein
MPNQNDLRYRKTSSTSILVVLIFSFIVTVNVRCSIAFTLPTSQQHSKAYYCTSSPRYNAAYASATSSVVSKTFPMKYVSTRASPTPLYALLPSETEGDIHGNIVDMDTSRQLFTNPMEKITAISLPVLLYMTLCIVPTTVLAADGGFLTISPTWNSALLAYGHYFFILLATILLTYERSTVTANMSIETEKSLVIADALYGVMGAFVGGTGYFRVISEYGKGWEYYAHEPIFWMKLIAASLLAGLSLFPTITYIKRGEKLFRNEDIEPMSEALAKRVRSVLNAELSAILSIPLFASLMARGVAYNEDFPWQLGATVAVLTLVGSGALYARQALTWTEP